MVSHGSIGLSQPAGDQWDVNAACSSGRLTELVPFGDGMLQIYMKPLDQLVESCLLFSCPKSNK